MSLFLAFLPTLLVTTMLLLAERWAGAPPADGWRNVQAWALQSGVAVGGLQVIHSWTGPALIDARRLPFWAGLLIFFVVKDLGEYLFHRAQHRIPVLWAMHSLHHCDPEVTVLTTQRHFWGDQLVKQVTIWSAALMVISPTDAILGSYGIISLWNLFAHCDVRADLGRWSWVVNCPAFHRRHHSCLPEHFNSNFAAILPIFDVIFGTYRRPEGFPPTGLPRAPANFAELVIWPLIWNRPVAERVLRV